MVGMHGSHEVRASAEGAPVVIHCSDPRFQPHFQDFLSQTLQMDHYALIAVPGGPQVLALEDRSAWKWMEFMVTLTHTGRVVLILHDDCRWYLQSLGGREPARVHEKMYEDARRVREALNERFGVQRVEIYHAKLVDSSAVFDSIS